MRTALTTILAAGLLTGGMAQAALVDRGGGLIYDTVRDITWLQTGTGARDIDGFISTVTGTPVGATMRYVDAEAWVEQFQYTNVNGVTFSNWRLPRLDLLQTTNQDGGPLVGNTGDFCTAFDGSCDRGFNNSNGELADLYYRGLNNLGEFLADGSESGICVGEGFGRICKSNYSFVDPLQFTINPSDPFGPATFELVSFDQAGGLYWYEQPVNIEDEEGNPLLRTFLFNMNTGSQDGLFNPGNSLRKAWAVHDGDIGAVIPVPAAAWLFASGLGLLGWLRRRNAG